MSNHLSSLESSDVLTRAQLDRPLIYTTGAEGLWFSTLEHPIGASKLLGSCAIEYKRH